MAGSPRFKVFNPAGEYIASTKHVEDAAAIIAGCYGEGAKIKDSGRIVWHEGHEDCPAFESYDRVAEVVWARIRATNQKALAKLRGQGIDI